MDPNIKKRWIEALTSGEYEQGVGCLRSENNTFCCLGVLTDIFLKAHDREWCKEENLRYYAFVENDTAEVAVLPEPVREWAKMPDERGCFPGGVLTSENDTGMPFAKIAEIIEEHF